MAKPVLVEYTKHLYGKDKHRQNPLKVIVSGFEIEADNKKIAIAESYYPKSKKHYYGVKLIPSYKVLKRKDNKQKLCRIKMQDTMMATEPLSLTRIKKWKNSVIEKIGFLLGEKTNHYIVSFMNVPEVEKFSEILYIPKGNVLELEILE